MSDKLTLKDEPKKPPHEVVAELARVAKAYGYGIENIVLVYRLQGAIYRTTGGFEPCPQKGPTDE